MFDGNNHTVANLTDLEGLGLFAYLVDGAEVRNLNLENFNIINGSGSVGALANGVSEGVCISGCSLKGGTVEGYWAGGLIGINRGRVESCTSASAVSGYLAGGLVGANWGTISDCNSFATVVGEYLCGGVVADSREGRISNCYAYGQVSGENNVGGLVGKNRDCEVINCSSSASVSGRDYVGGLVGLNSGLVFASYNAGDIDGRGETGGAVGRNGGIVSNCYSTGTVYGLYRFGGPTGGLIGYNMIGTVRLCYSAGPVSAENEDAGGLVGRNEASVIMSYWDVESSGAASSAGGEARTTEQMRQEATFDCWGCSSLWKIDEGRDYPRLIWEDTPGKTFSYEKIWEGAGTAGDPHRIYCAKDLSRISHFPCAWDKHFVLMADIDVTHISGGCIGSIGSRKSGAFAGTFDGAGRTISGFRHTTADPNGYVGLFGYVGINGEIRDLTLMEPVVGIVSGDAAHIDDPNYLAETQNTGALVGKLDEGVIRNCRVENGAVMGKDYVGGLVGYGSGGIIVGCDSTCNVTGTGREVGGLAGTSYSQTISMCRAQGTVRGVRYVGGLVGYQYGWYDSDGIDGSCSAGHVIGTLGVGGLVGRSGNAAISTCYSTCDVKGNTHVGGLVGTCWDTTFFQCYSAGVVEAKKLYLASGFAPVSEDSVTASFWDASVNPSLPAGLIGVSTEAMMTKETFVSAGWDFTGETVNGIEDIWFILPEDYPRLWWTFVPILHAEPEITPGTINSISWDSVAGDVEYYVECAEDEDFTSIVCDSGWILETSCEFIDLELGRRYWYRVNARNAAGVESGWSNVESSLQGTLGDAVDVVLDPASLKNKNMKNALLNKIDEALGMIDAGLYEDALNKLEHDILAKTNGCAETGEPDKNDWIISCEEQSQVYGLVMETIEYVRSLLE